MPLSRVELIARGFAHADKAYPGGIPLNTLLSSPQIHSLTPEDKISVIHRYDELSGGKPTSAPSYLSTVGDAMLGGITSAAPIAILGGALTVPSALALKSAKGAKAWLQIGKKVAAPIALTAGIGMVAGGLYGTLKHMRDAKSNKYLAKTMDQIRSSTDQDDKNIKTMALLTTSPLINREMDESERHSDTGINMAVGHLVNRDLYSQLLPSHVVPTFEESGEEHPIGGSSVGHSGFTHVPYNDWRYVEGIGSLDPTVDKSGTLGKAFVRQSRYNNLPDDIKAMFDKLPKDTQEQILRGQS